MPSRRAWVQLALPELELKPEDWQVRLIRRKNEAALIEWHDPATGYRQRAYVPFAVLKAARHPATGEMLVFCAKPYEGLPYGEPWEQLITAITLHVDPEVLAGELRKADIWTADDLRQAPQRALSAIQTVLGLTLSALMQAARAQEEVDHGTL